MNWILVIVFALVAFHSYDVYNEQMKAEEMEQK